MAKRIVRIEYESGDVYFAVETNKILGFILCKWRLCNTKSIHTNMENKAFFKKYVYAVNFVNYGDPMCCKEEVVKKFKDK